MSERWDPAPYEQFDFDSLCFLVVASDIEEDDGSWLLLYPSVRTEQFRTLVVPQGAGLLLNLLELLGTIIPVP